MLTYAFAISALALAAKAQSTSPTSTISAQTTISGLVGPYSSGFAASVMPGDACSTTLAYNCVDFDVCSIPANITGTVTQGPSDVRFVYSTSTSGSNITQTQSCTLLAAPNSTVTALGCVNSLTISQEGSITANGTSLTITDPSYYNFQPVTVTDGASNLPASGAAASCTPSHTDSTDTLGVTKTSTTSAASASGTSSHSGAKPSGIAELYKIVVVPVGAAVLAGAAFV